MEDKTRKLFSQKPTVEDPGTLTNHNSATAAELEILETARSLLDRVNFPLDTAEVSEDCLLLTRTKAQLDDYVLPRLASLEAPLTVVVGGSTGAGKSTLVNTLLGEPITRAGAIRPTTHQPVLVYRAEDREALSPERILPHMERIMSGQNEPVGAGRTTTDADRIFVVETNSIPAGIALIDAPDIDSVSEDNRRLAKQLLAAADLWLFVTTANRYADAVPWEILHEAAARDITVAVVLNRVPAGSETEIETDLRRMLTEAGIVPAHLLTVTEQSLDARGMLPPAALEPLAHWMRELGNDSVARSRIARQTLEGAVNTVAERMRQLGAARQRQAETLDRLQAAVHHSYARAQENIIDSTQDGALLRGEVLARWQDFVGTGDFFRGLETGIGRLRDRIAGFFRGQPQQAVEVEEALETGLHAVIIEEATNAAENSQRLWLEERAGRDLLGSADLGRVNADFSERVAQGIRSWQQDLMDMIREEGAYKRQRARFMSLGINATAVVLMVAVFSTTGGLTGLEVGIAGGSGVIGMKLLEAVFGEDAVRRMAAAARTNLETRIRELLDDHSEIFTGLLDQLHFGADTEQLFEAANSVGRAAKHLRGNRTW